MPKDDETLSKTVLTAAPDPSAPLEIGAVLGSRYRINGLLGRGATGSVYLAYDAALGKSIALKQVDGAAPRQQEVTLAHQVTHPNVCRTYDLEAIGGRWLLKMEFVDGVTLAEYVDDAGGRLAIDESVAIARQIADGLAAAHAQKIVHRDLKPQNVMIERRTGRVVIMDFGIARHTDDITISGGGVVGTPYYMAPEQAGGRGVDGRADLYALGCVLYYMIAGRVVFPTASDMTLDAALRYIQETPPDDIRKMRRDAPGWLVLLVAGLLEKDPEKRRPHDAAAVSDVLAARGRSRLRGRLAIGLGALVVAAAAAIVLVVTRRHDPDAWQPKITDLPAYDENSDNVDVSADGTSIVYTSDREQRGHYRLYLESLVDGAARPLTPPGFMAFFGRFTADGTAVWVKSVGPLGVYRQPLDGAEPQLVLVDGEARAVATCGDGVVFARPSPPRLVLQPPTGEATVLALVEQGDILQVRCDREGRQVVYALSKGNDVGMHWASDLWLATFDGNVRRLTHDSRQNRLGSFHPDGKSIVYSSDASGRSQLWELPLAGGSPVMLTSGDGDHTMPIVLPDGQRILYDIDETAAPLFAVDLASSGTPRRLTSKLEIIEGIDVAPDGDELVVSAEHEGRRDVVLVPAHGGAERTLAAGTSPIFDPRGRDILFVDAADARRVLAVPRSGGATRLVTLAPSEVQGLAVGSDDQVHIRTQTSALVAPLAGGKAESDAPRPFVQLWPAPAGGWRLAIIDLGRMRVLAPGMAPDDPHAAELTGWRTFAWARDGRSFYYVLDQEIRRFTVETGATERALAAGDVIHMAPSPDGATLYLISPVAHTRRAIITNYGERSRPWARP